MVPLFTGFETKAHGLFMTLLKPADSSESVPAPPFHLGFLTWGLESPGVGVVTSRFRLPLN